MVERFSIGDACEILVGRGLATTAESWHDLDGRRAVVVTQPGAADTARRVSAQMTCATAVTTHMLPDGEPAKTLQSLQGVFATCVDAGLGRGDLVVAVGGGTVSDVAGFAAATYLRGVAWIGVPTTLLAAVDAAVGGKTGVNFSGKNLVGAFHHPRRVHIDLDELERLPASLRTQGMAEALKAGMVGDSGLVDLIEAAGMAAPLQEVVPRAVAVKVAVVGEDFREGGRRAVLNYGHTVGHAVEVAAGLSHGSAVAVGMVAAAAAGRVVTGFDERQRHASIVESLGLPTSAIFDRARVEMLIGMDKKRDEAGIRMVLLEAVGVPVVVHVEAATLAIAIDSVDEGSHAT